MKKALGVLIVLTIGCIAPAHAQEARLRGTNIPSSVRPWYQTAVAQQQRAATPSAPRKVGPVRVRAAEVDCIACAVYTLSETYRTLWHIVADVEGEVKFVAGCAKYCPF